jgi:hypothetical protein
MITQPFSGLGLGANGYLFNAAFFHRRPPEFQFRGVACRRKELK